MIFLQKRVIPVLKNCLSTSPLFCTHSSITLDYYRVNLESPFAIFQYSRREYLQILLIPLALDIDTLQAPAHLRCLLIHTLCHGDIIPFLQYLPLFMNTVMLLTLSPRQALLPQMLQTAIPEPLTDSRKQYERSSLRACRPRIGRELFLYEPPRCHLDKFPNLSYTSAMPPYPYSLSWRYDTVLAVSDSSHEQGDTYTGSEAASAVTDASDSHS